MIIGIDGNEANQEKRVGIGEYSFELLKKFEEFPISNIQFQIYLKERPKRELPKKREGWGYRVIGPKKLWTQIALPLDLYFQKPRPDIFFTPSHYAPRFSIVPTAISIMDLSYLHFPHLFKTSDLYQLKQWTGYSVKKAKRIFTISKASKNDIITAYEVLEEKVIITYPGIKEVSSIKYLPRRQAGQVLSMEQIRGKYGIEGEYILFVGTLQPRKNIVRLIEAFSKIKNEISLVIIGKKGWLYEDILKAPKKFNVVNKVKFLDFMPNEDMQAFYKHALFFILPSLYEGFGLPILEAMVNGCAVITSNVSSLPEAGGDAALYVDPENTEDIAEKMQTLLKNDKLRKELIEKGHKQAKKFSWEKTAKKTLEVLQSMASEK